MDELYLDNIDEFVNDHNKIVTYKWLSLTLGVHVNTAKQMLYHYLDHKRKESSEPLHATYLVSGKLVENGLTCHKVSVVREDQLEDVKSKMSMTVSVHVYSVQKAVLKDSGPLYSVDYDAVKDHMKNCSKYSAIQCASAVPMSRAEVQQTRQAPTIEPEHVKQTVNGHASLASKPSTKPSKGIMGMFATKPATKKQEASKEIKPEPKEEATVDEAPKSKPAGKTNPMSNFFGNQAAKKPEKKEDKKEEAVQAASSEEPRPSASQPEDKLIDVAVPQEQTKDAKKEITDTKKETKDTKKEIRSKTKRMQESDSEEEKMDKKRRRRIKKPVSDSSEDEEEEVIPDSPQPQKRREPSPCPEMDVEESLSHANQQRSDGKRRKRRRVLKSRTFLDEDGCMVTEKGYESESYSEAEEEVPSSQTASKNPVQAKLPTSSKDDDKKKKEKKSAANANKGTKQASIMGFFQKK